MKPGWNLISLPFAPLDSRPTAVFADSANRAQVQIGPVWEWDGTRYRPAVTIRAYSGLLAFVTSTKTITVTGFAVAPEVLLQPGWNLIGPAAEISPPVEARLTGSFWGWNGRGLCGVEFLVPGLAYWVFAREPVMIPLGR